MCVCAQVIIDISMEIVQGKHSEVGASAHMRNGSIVDKAVDLVRDQVRRCTCTQPRRAWVYFVLTSPRALLGSAGLSSLGLCRRLVADGRTWGTVPRQCRVH